MVTLRHSIAVTVTSSNNAPTMTAPVGLPVWKRTSLPLAGVQGRDVDTTAKTTANFRLNLTVAHGALTLKTTVSGGLTAAQIRGNGTKRVVINAPLRAINRTLAAAGGLVYRGNLNYVGADSVTAVLSDRGNTGTGGAKSCTVNTAITVQGDLYDVWRNARFAEADLKLATKEQSVWGDNADPDADGRDNLMEFALGSDPYVKQSSTNGIVSSLLQTNAAAHFSLTFIRRSNQSVVSYVPEVSSDGHDWSSTGVEVLQVQPVDATFERVTCRDTTPVIPGQLRLMRLRLSRPSP